MGLPERVTALLKAVTRLEHLTYQVDQEKNHLTNEAGLRHLSRREILQMRELRESPP
jgi:hypothetical protein